MGAFKKIPRNPRFIYVCISKLIDYASPTTTSRIGNHIKLIPPFLKVLTKLTSDRSQRANWFKTYTNFCNVSILPPVVTKDNPHFLCSRLRFFTSM